MTCDDVQDRLDDYVDGELSEADFHAVELHVAGCAACRDEERLLRAVLSHAQALPREKTPRADLWPGIKERIASGEGGRATNVLPFARRLVGSGPGLTAVAATAAALVALAVGLSLRPRPARETPLAGGPPLVSSTPAIENVSAGPGPLLDAEADYERATAALLNALEARRSSLAPETLKNVEENLAVIDRALEEVRQALKKDPTNPELTRMLASTHRKKVDVLRRVVRFST
jgi:tetratricopeptide (TPR) repeat protein